MEVIDKLINKVIGSFNNLPADYKVTLIRIFQGIIDGIKHLDEIKVDKEDGKGLSSNDFTDELKDKLDNIEPGATVQVPSDWESVTGVTRILNKPDLTVYPDSAEWNSIDKKIYFKHQGTIINAFTIDGTDFIKDGMVEDVKIVNNNLVITFNTDYGKEDIVIPLFEIFNPDNYYTKDKTDELFVKKVNGKDLSTEDFTTELKDKLENIKPNTQVILITNNEGDYCGASYSLKEFINNIDSVKELNFLFLLHVNTVNRDMVYRTFNKGRFIAIPHTRTNSEDANYKYITLMCNIYGEAYEQKAGYDETKFYDRGLGFICSEQFIINIRYNNNIAQYKTTLPKGTTYGNYSTLTNFRYYYDYPHIKALLGEITSYTNEQIEQLIAEGNQVKIFKLDIAEDKTLLQQILTDNPQDGIVDITSIMYFVYDSTKQKYYDVNSITIATIESDRQININAAIGKYDYTAIKINTNNAKYIINPSHIEGTNSDWDENDEDKANYIKNRTHYIDDNGVVHHLDSKYLEDLTESEIDEILE